MTRRAIQVSAVAESSAGTSISNSNIETGNTDQQSFLNFSSSSSSVTPTMSSTITGHNGRAVRTCILKKKEFNKKIVRTSPRFNPNFYAMFRRESETFSNDNSTIIDDQSEDFDDVKINMKDTKGTNSKHNRKISDKEKDNDFSNDSAIHLEHQTENMNDDTQRNSVFDELTDLSDMEDITDDQVIENVCETSLIIPKRNFDRLSKRTVQKIPLRRNQRNLIKKSYNEDSSDDDEDVKLLIKQKSIKKLNKKSKHNKNIKKIRENLIPESVTNGAERISKSRKTKAKAKTKIKALITNNIEKVKSFSKKINRKRTKNIKISAKKVKKELSKRKIDIAKTNTTNSSTRSNSKVTSSKIASTSANIQQNNSQNIAKSSNKTTTKSTNNHQIDDDSNLCQFCQTDTDSNHLLGELHRLEDIIAHKYCLLFASGLVMRGEYHEGIDGFLLKDIRKELSRGKKLKCSYCPQRGAVVGCEVKQCKANYHLPCGIKNGAFNQFHNEDGSYPSTCINHREALPVIYFEGSKLCTICQDTMECKKNNMKVGKIIGNSSIVHYTCCGSYFHRDCICQWAYHEGEFHLKCPNCNNENDFKKATKNYGIHVPKKDREFLNPTQTTTNNNSRQPESITLPNETLPFAGSTLRANDNDNNTESSNREQPNIQGDAVVFTCDAQNCKCNEGRTFNGTVGSIWELYACDRCGANSIHVACCVPPLQDGEREWFCEICSLVD